MVINQKIFFSLMVLDSGDTAWMLVAGSLVLLMIPALGLFNLVYLERKTQLQFLCKYFSDWHF